MPVMSSFALLMRRPDDSRRIAVCNALFDLFSACWPNSDATLVLMTVPWWSPCLWSVI